MKPNKKYTFEELWNRLPQHVREMCDNCEQDPVYHPEIWLTVHIKNVFNNVVNFFNSDPDLLIASIFHDIGKPETQKIIIKDDGTKKISNISHEHKCEEYINKYFELFSDITTNKEKVIEICKYHMKAHLYINKKIKKPSKIKAFEELKYFNDIIKFAICDGYDNKGYSISLIDHLNENIIL